MHIQQKMRIWKSNADVGMGVILRKLKADKYIKNLELFKMSKPVVLAVGDGGCRGKVHLMALYAREKVADDMYKSSRTAKEKEFYKKELEEVRAEIGNMMVCD